MHWLRGLVVLRQPRASLQVEDGLDLSGAVSRQGNRHQREVRLDGGEGERTVYDPKRGSH